MNGEPILTEAAPGSITGEVGGAVGEPIVGNTGPDVPQFGEGPRTIIEITKTTTTQQVPQLVTGENRTITNPKGPLYTCPLWGVFHVGDDFGAPRYAGGYHPHGGNDIFAAQGTPVVAPFDGVAENAANGLGGNAVIVRGANGYVYNAHLSAYGKLGEVHVGEVIGYVGNTGDAQGTAYHDHFEWHPYAGPTLPSPTTPWVGPYGHIRVDSGTTPAVDPFPYLLQACPH